MLYVEIPQPDRHEVGHLDRAEDQEGAQITVWTMKKFLFEVVLTDPNFGQGKESFMAVADIRDAVNASYSEGKSYIALRQSDITRIKKVIDNPGTARNPAGMSQLLPLMLAFDSPLKEEPGSTAEAPAEAPDQAG